MNYSLTIKIILILLFIYLLIIFYVYTKQRSLLYVPQIDNYDDELLIIPAEQVFIENSSNIKLTSYQNMTKIFYLFLGDHIVVMMVNLLRMVYMMTLEVL